MTLLPHQIGGAWSWKATDKHAPTRGEWPEISCCQRLLMNPIVAHRPQEGRLRPGCSQSSSPSPSSAKDCPNWLLELLHPSSYFYSSAAGSVDTADPKLTWRGRSTLDRIREAETATPIDHRTTHVSAVGGQDLRLLLGQWDGSLNMPTVKTLSQLPPNHTLCCSFLSYQVFAR